MNYTLIFDDTKGSSTSIEMQYILLIFNEIKINFKRIKKNDLKITLIKNDGNLSEYLSKPKNTNVLIQMVKHIPHYQKFAEIHCSYLL